MKTRYGGMLFLMIPNPIINTSYIEEENKVYVFVEFLTASLPLAPTSPEKCWVWLNALLRYSRAFLEVLVYCR